MTIDPKLVEAVKFIREAGEHDLKRIVDELQVNRPDLFGSLVEAFSNGEHVEGLFNLALGAVLDRKDLDDSVKDDVRAGADAFLAMLEIFRETPGLSRLRQAIFEFAGIALLTGLQAGLSPVEFENLRSKQVQGGKNSAAGREARWNWKPHATELAKEVNPGLSDGDVAKAIEGNWNRADLKCPGRKSLEILVSNLRNSGGIPRRRRLPRKPPPRKGPKRISWK